MYYVSTRDAGRRLTASQAIVEGLSRDGGLYLPEEIPQLTMDEIKALAALSYPERAAKIMKRYLDEFTEEELLGFAKSAYGPAKFDTPAAAPVVKLTENTYIQELWHGPTCAFKDMALQMLPYLLTASLRKTGEEKTVCILVATSGDTGKAALEGFRDVDRTKILVFYPDGGVSEMQKLQMVTQEGKNVGVCAVRGNFDDAQTGVKRIFSDEALREELAGRGYFLSSANSINWGRILPQVVYYISAYCDLVRDGKLKSEVEFIGLSSYKNATKSSGCVQITRDLQRDISGRDIIVVEDILDSGNTLAFLKDYMLAKGAKSITIVTLLDKPARREKAITADLSGFVVPDEFVVGYGLDYCQQYRNMPYIGVLKPEVYSK